MINTVFSTYPAREDGIDIIKTLASGLPALWRSEKGWHCSIKVQPNDQHLFTGREIAVQPGSCDGEGAGVLRDIQQDARKPLHCTVKPVWEDSWLPNNICGVFPLPPFQPAPNKKAEPLPTSCWCPFPDGHHLLPECSAQPGIPQPMKRPCGTRLWDSLAAVATVQGFSPSS